MRKSIPLFWVFFVGVTGNFATLSAKKCTIIAPFLPNSHQTLPQANSFFMPNTRNFAFQTPNFSK